MSLVLLLRTLVLLRVSSLYLRLDKAFKSVADVPAGSKSLRLTKFYDYLVCSCATQGVNVYPSYTTEQLSYLSIGLFVSVFITFASQRTPEGSVCAIQMLLNCPCTTVKIGGF